MLTIKIAPDWFEFTGESTLADLQTLIDKWFAARPSADAAALAKVITKLERQNADLAATVTRETPPT